MKISRLLLRIIGLIFIFFLLLSSCSKNDQSPEYSFFVSKQLSVTFKKEYINNLLTTASGTMPEVNPLKSHVTSDINVYAIIYKTAIDSKEIKASGLVCVPSTPGNYPVLSFQNGTNTVNALSPSQYPLGFSYQMVEMIASMGYIVVLADYPGFGESVQLPHPYLVKTPTVQSLVDILYAVREMANSELPGITLKNEYYLLGYSQGGWATLALHKALELDYSGDFNLKGSACGAGPYDIFLLMQDMVNVTIYPMPVYLGYIWNAYSYYNQFPNPVTDIFNEPYAARLGSLFNGTLTSDQINSQLTTSIPGLINPAFLSGFTTSAKYSPVRDALNNNSVSAWHTTKSLLLIHGGNDTQVNPVSTENMYSEMIQAGTSPELCKKVILPGLDHGDGAFPCMIQGILFLMNINSSN